jgi:TolB protein
LRTNQNAKRPTLSSDGKWIAFDGTPPGKPPLSEFNIQVVRVDGTGMRTLAASHEWELDAQWSPDSHRLSFSRMPPGADFLHSWVWTVGLDGTDLQRLGRGSMARWSPDGKKLVIEAPTPDTEGDLFVINANGGGRHPLLATPDLEAPAAWSPNGRRILFTRFDSGGVADVFAMDADGSHVSRLTCGSGQNIAAAWSPDGSKILFASDRTGRSQLFVMDADGTHRRNISRNHFNEFDPSWHR